LTRSSLGGDTEIKTELLLLRQLQFGLSRFCQQDALAL
jgi:hypothetical protein